jgi:hypothetical protein
MSIVAVVIPLVLISEGDDDDNKEEEEPTITLSDGANEPLFTDSNF